MKALQGKRLKTALTRWLSTDHSNPQMNFSTEGEMIIKLDKDKPMESVDVIVFLDDLQTKSV